MNKKQLLGLIGSLVLIIGVFTPIVSLPFVGSMNYFNNGNGDGTIVLILAIASLVVVFLKKYKFLWITGLASLGMMLFTFINFQGKMASVKSEMQSGLEGNPFAGLGELALQSVQLQWGWIILVIGAVLLIVSAAIKEDTEKQETPALQG
ncbi:hypothetical protein A3A75_05595 [Candidatus Woesebacteria bacterium RIFCSPLOWO2_01_FULL_39_10]|uniref:Uncharacterized protein n=1 Tax=Candidatus Woesebacteria bacterium RIFCSPLOWO2_01_FULL_39_10 TaxID=1802516 RepID=A0A1F8B4Y5_9BACT|nr:MAG: hypothetical protein A3A75_05595 [Candidatus Woesebacteria bacterium RIFCSPLOWO2_01_FULL_39_10]